MVFKVLTILTIVLTITCLATITEARFVRAVRSDVIETKYVPDPSETKLKIKLINRQASSDVDAVDPNVDTTADDVANAKKPGWMVRSFRKIKNFFKRQPENELDLSHAKEFDVNVENQRHNETEKRTQLMRFGDITSRVSNSLGGSAMRVAGVIEKLCKMLKTVIPIVAAVCNVGQFKFCMSADAPIELGEAMNRPLDLNQPDR